MKRREIYDGRKGRLRKEAEERNTKWAALTPAEQLRELDRRGVVAEKQRTRILKKLSANIQ